MTVRVSGSVESDGAGKVNNKETMGKSSNLSH